MNPLIKRESIRHLIRIRLEYGNMELVKKFRICLPDHKFRIYDCPSKKDYNFLHYLFVEVVCQQEAKQITNLVIAVYTPQTTK